MAESSALQVLDHRVTAMEADHAAARLVLMERIASLTAENQVLRAELVATRSMAWVCLASSPIAQEMLERERQRGFDQSLTPALPNQSERALAVTLMESSLMTAKAEPRRGLAALSNGLVYDLSRTLESIIDLRRWSVRGALWLVSAALAAHIALMVCA